MNKVFAAAGELQTVCESHHWEFCFIGGVALQHWGAARETVDADLTLLTGFGNEEPYIQSLLDNFESRTENAMQFALANRVLLLKSREGVGLDIALAGLPFEESAVARAAKVRISGNGELRICSAEDLIIMKVFAGRGQDWVDIEQILIRQDKSLNWDYMREQLNILSEMKAGPGLVDLLLEHHKKLNI